MSEIEINKLLRFSNLSRKGLKMQFEVFRKQKDNDYAVTMAKGWVEKYVKENFEKGLMFYGPTGTGKTHLVCSIANRLIRKYGLAVHFMSTVNLPRNDTGLIYELSDRNSVPVLILDDLGAEKLTARALECLYILIDNRLMNEAPILVTTNFGVDKEKSMSLWKWIEEGGEGYGDRLFGRLRESCDFVPVGGCDKRLRK